MIVFLGLSSSSSASDSVVNNGDGSYTVNAVLHSDGYYHVSDNLKLYLPDDFNGSFTLSAEAYSRDTTEGTVASNSVDFTRVVDPVSDTPTITVTNTSGLQVTSSSLTSSAIDFDNYSPANIKVDAALTSGIADELSLTLEITGLTKNGSAVSGVISPIQSFILEKPMIAVDLQGVSGAYSAGVYTLNETIATAAGYDDLSSAVADLYLVPELDRSGIFTIRATAISQDIGNADPSENSSNIEVQVFQVAQTPSVTLPEYAEGSVAASSDDFGTGDNAGEREGLLISDGSTSLAVAKGSDDDTVSVLVQGVFEGAYFINSTTGSAVGAQGATGGIWVFDVSEIENLMMIVPTTQLGGVPVLIGIGKWWLKAFTGAGESKVWRLSQYHSLSAGCGSNWINHCYNRNFSFGFKNRCYKI